MAAHSWAIRTSGLLSLLGCLLLATPPRAAAPSWGRAVASESHDSVRDALGVLHRGGSAIDAAIVAALVAGVTSPTSSGLGGGGFAIYWDAAKQKPFVLDFRETAPSAAQREPLERRPLGPAEAGHLIGVPGEVRGLFALHERAGRLPWANLVGVAAHRARSGFSVQKHLAQMLSLAQDSLADVPGLGLYFPGGRPAPVGRRLVNLPLAETLAKIAAEGPAGFYSGAVAEDVVGAARAHGSPLSVEDLETYRPVWRDPIHVRYDGADVYTMPPPSAGGLMVAQLLTMFPADDLRRLGQNTPAYQHMIAESMRGSVADRALHLADPDAHPVPLERLLDPERLAARRETFAVDRTHALGRFVLREEGTHALVTADREGNVVSLTTTINLLFGAKIVAGKCGVVLNNELDDFSARSDVEELGLRDTPNRLRPGARPVSSMTPTIVVRDGQPLLAVGGSGGRRIASNVTQVLLNALVFDKSAQSAVSEPRLYVPTSGATLQLEAGASPGHVEDLKWRGEIVAPPSAWNGAVQLLLLRDGRTEAAADPRKHGAAQTN